MGIEIPSVTACPPGLSTPKKYASDSFMSEPAVRAGNPAGDEVARPEHENMIRLLLLTAA